MGLLSLFKNLNLGFGMPHMPTTTSAGTMQAKEFKGVEQGNKLPLVGDHHEITGAEKDTRIKSDEIGSCTYGMDWKINYPSRKDNVTGKLEEAVSGQRRLTKFKGDQGLRTVTSSENDGQIECKVNFLGLPIRPGEKKCPFYMRTGGCKFASRCRFHHPDPTAVVGDVLQDRKNGVPSQHHGPVEELCEMLRPSENTSSEQTAFLGPFTPNRGVQQNVHWIGNPTTTSPLHSQEMNINGQRKTLANKDIGYEFSGVELQKFEDYPQRPSEPECLYFMKTGYCKFKSACRYHHPKSHVSFVGLPEGLVSDNYQHHGPVEQLRVTPLPSENCSNEATALCVPPSSYAPDLFTPNQGLKPNAQWNENQMATSPLDPPEIKMDEKGQELTNKDTAYEFNGDANSQQFDEYPQRPSAPQCQYFMKTGSCKFKSACRFHHPKPNLSVRASPQKSMAASPLHPPLPETKKNEKDQELANKDTAHEFNGGVKSQQFDEYPQRPGEPECQHFMKTGYCKFKSACRCHHPKSNLSFPARRRKPDKPICTHFSRSGICKFGSACRFSHHIEHT